MQVTNFLDGKTIIKCNNGEKIESSSKLLRSLANFLIRRTEANGELIKKTEDEVATVYKFNHPIDNFES